MSEGQERTAAHRRRKPGPFDQLSLTARAARTALSARLACLDLHSGQDAVLLALGREDGLPLRDLAERLAVKPPTVTKTIQRLAAQGFVERRAHPGDGRQGLAHLTETGRRLLDEIGQAQREVEAVALAGLAKKDRRRLRKLLRRIERNLRAPNPAESQRDAS